MKRIQIFELGLGKVTIIPFKELIPDYLVEKLKAWGSTLGVGLEITNVESAEKFVEHFFREKGYQVVITIQSRGFLEDLERQKKLPMGIAAAASEAGTPDYFCYKDGTDWFFTEAKNEHDGIRLTQLNWFYNHKYPTKVLYLAEAGPNKEKT